MLYIDFIDLEQELKDFELYSSYEPVSEFLDEKFDILDAFAREAFVTPLSHFACNLEEEPDDKAADYYDNWWFQPEDGVKTVRALLAFLNSPPQNASSKPIARYTRDFQKSGLFGPALDDLTELCGILLHAQELSKGVRFRFYTLFTG